MMKVALLSGALKNAGDFLITHRSRELLLFTYPDAEIRTYIRNFPLNAEHLSQINEMDAIVIAGGPCLLKNFYPEYMPLAEDLSLLKPKMFLLGGGIARSSVKDSELSRYKFSSNTLSLFSRIVRDTGRIGCRDLYSVKALQANGIENSIMTGCPAWYDLENLDKRFVFHKDINKIAVSDPANALQFGKQSIGIVKFLKRRFPKAEIIYLFHRGVSCDQYTNATMAQAIDSIREKLDELEIESCDISYGHEGFNFYSDCDLHVGHRVHAHIYNLSQRRCSILIEEDARGAGVNDTLGLRGIKAYSKNTKQQGTVWAKGYNKLFRMFFGTNENTKCLTELEEYLNYMEDSRGSLFSSCFKNMEFYFDIMQAHIKSLEEYI